ncbi:unnamed protein product [Discosporangium mesarthrocarpum]
MSGRRGIKRRFRDESSYEEYGSDKDDFFDVEAVPNDTVAAILSLQRDFYGGGEAARTGVVLQHQIYTILSNRTAVDLELTDMRNENKLRFFQLNTGKDEYGIIHSEHYLRLVSICSFGLQCCKSPVQTKERFLRDRPSPPLSPPTRVNFAQQFHAFFWHGVNVSCVARGRGSMGSILRCTTRIPEPGTVASTEGSVAGAAQHPILGKDGCGEQEPMCFSGCVLREILKSNTKAYAERREVTLAMKRVLMHCGVREDGGMGGEAGVTKAGAGGRKVREGYSGGRAGGKGGEGDGEEMGLETTKKMEERVSTVVSELIRAGFLLPRRDVGPEDAYWFFIPELGKFMNSVRQGRGEILSALKRTRYKEARRDALEKKRLSKSGLPVTFHIRDMLGLGIVRELDTPAGVFIKIAT